jgi:signal transduction histidine kinase
LKKHNADNEEPLVKDANHELVGRPDHFFAELVHEFTNTVTAVIRYSELALHAIEDSHPAREWIEKIRSQAKQLASLARKFTDLRQKSQHDEQT